MCDRVLVNRWKDKTSLTEKVISMIYYLEARENLVRCKNADNIIGD